MFEMRSANGKQCIVMYLRCEEGARDALRVGAMCCGYAVLRTCQQECVYAALSRGMNR